MLPRSMTRRQMLRAGGGVALGVGGAAILAACGETQVVTQEKIVTQQVEKIVQVEKEVPVEKVVQKIVTREVAVEKVVTQEVERIVTVVIEQPIGKPRVRLRGTGPLGTPETGIFDKLLSETQIELDHVEQPYAATYQSLLINLSQGGSAYDIASMDDPWMPQFTEFLADITPLYQGFGWVWPDPDMIPAIVDLGDWPPGKYGPRAVPNIGNIQSFAYRTDVMEDLGVEPPKTWDEVAEYSTKITGDMAPDLYGYTIRGQPGNPAMTSFLPIMRGFGRDVIDGDLNPQVNTEEGLAALDMVVTLKNLAPPGVENIGHHELGKLIYTGLAAMSGDVWPDQLLKMYTPDLSKVVGKIDVLPEPAQPGADHANMTGVWLFGVPQGSENHEAAAEAIHWLTQAENQKENMYANNWPPVRFSLMDDPGLLADFPFLAGIKNAASVAVPRPRTEHYSIVEEIVGRHVSAVIAEQESVGDAARLADEEVRVALEEKGAYS